MYLCTSPCDMRRSFDGLHALVTGAMQLDAFAGHLFVFANRRKDRVEDFDIGIAMGSRCGPSVWRKVLTRCRSGKQDEAQRERSRRKSRRTAKRHRSEHCEAAQAVPAREPGSRIK